MAIINSIEELKETAKVNKDTPFENWRIYLNDAQDHFLIPYLGDSLVERLESIDVKTTAKKDKKYIRILQLARRAVGPYAVMLSTDEMSINTGNNGHTVLKTDSMVPASDSKIAKAANSLLERAWKNLEILLGYLEENINRYPKWKGSKYYQNCRTKYFPSAVVFQDSGLIDIEYSRLSFEKLRQLIIRIEHMEVKSFISPQIEAYLFSPSEENKEKATRLMEMVRAFIGSKVGELHTSQNTRQQRSKYNNLEYKALIRPLYKDEVDNNPNYYAEQAGYWMEQIMNLLPELGFETVSGKLDWDNQNKKIFSAII